LLIRGPRYSLLTRRRVAVAGAPAAGTFIDGFEDETDSNTYVFSMTAAPTMVLGIAGRRGAAAIGAQPTVTVHQPDIATDPTGVAAIVAGSANIQYGTGDNRNRATIYTVTGLSAAACEVQAVWSTTLDRCFGYFLSATGLQSLTPTAVASDVTFSSGVLSTTIDCEAGGFVVAVMYAPSASTLTWAGIDEADELGTVSGFAFKEFASAQTGLTVSCTSSDTAATQGGLLVAAFR